MMTKFNKDMYAKMRSKKDEPLSSLGKRTVCIIGKGPLVTPSASVTPIVSGTEIVRTTSKRPWMTDKGKEKTDSRSSNVWDDKGLVEERAHGAMTTEDLKVISGVSFNEVVTRHVHKLV